MLCRFHQPLPKLLGKEAEKTRRDQKLCDLYHTDPPVSYTEIGDVRLHAIYIIDVDGLTIRETDPPTYMDRALPWRY